MANYPGSFIINEVGTRKELAKSYGVSERTIYRWLNKAAKESGQKARTKTRRPRRSTLEKFSGTRKELAKKYGVSERTAYRWLKAAKAQGAQIGSRKKQSKYPGADIINGLMINTALTNKQIGEQFGVTADTAARWIRRARLEQPLNIPYLRTTENYRLRRQNGTAFYEEVEPEDIGEPWEVLPPDEDIGEPWEVPPPDEDIGEPWEVPPPDEDIGEPWEVPEGIGDATANQLADIEAILKDTELIDKDSPFWDLTPEERIIYLNDYIRYQFNEDPYQFNQSPDPEEGPNLKDPEKIANINIWGEDFDFWLENEMEINK